MWQTFTGTVLRCRPARHRLCLYRGSSIRRSQTIHTGRQEHQRRASSRQDLRRFRSPSGASGDRPEGDPFSALNSLVIDHLAGRRASGFLRHYRRRAKVLLQWNPAEWTPRSDHLRHHGVPMQLWITIIQTTGTAAALAAAVTNLSTALLARRRRAEDVEARPASRHRRRAALRQRS
jgi:hypothetical protein